MLRDANEGDTLTFKHFEHSGEVHQRSAEAIDFVDYDAIDFAGFDIREQSFQGWAIHVATGVSAIVVVIGKADPAFGFLALDVAFRRFALSI